MKICAKVMVVLVFIGLSFVTRQVEATHFSSQIDELINDTPTMNGSIVGVSIRSAATGETVYEHMGDIRLRPASNLKLVTAAAALSTLGPSYTFATELVTDGFIINHKLQGNLILRGKGDPTLLPSDFDSIAKKLKDSGVHVVEGDLIGDDKWYDGVRYSKDMMWNDEDKYYGAQVSALTISPTKDYDAGTVLLTIEPANKIGVEPTISLQPKTDYVNVKNNATTVTAKGENTITIQRKHGSNTITINGSTPIDGKLQKEWIALWEPTGYALDIFANALKKQGIQLKGKIKVNQNTRETTKPIVTHSSMPLEKLLVPFLKLSNNGHGEVLIKEMGKYLKGKGSWDEGLEVVREVLPQYDVNPNTMVLRDGSGISHINLIPANELSKLLYEIQNEKWFDSFYNALPIAANGEKMEGGTLRSRLKGSSTNGKVRAKTGTLSTVSSLAGYMETKSGQKYVFAILVNNIVNEKHGKQFEDQLITILSNQ